MSEILFRSAEQLAEYMFAKDRKRFRASVQLHSELAKRQNLELIPPYEQYALTSSRIRSGKIGRYQPSYPTDLTVVLFHPEHGLAMGRVPLLHPDDFFPVFAGMVGFQMPEEIIKEFMQHPEIHTAKLFDFDWLPQKFHAAQFAAEQMYGMMTGSVPPGSTLFLLGGSDLQPLIGNSDLQSGRTQEGYAAHTRFGTREGIVFYPDPRSEKIAFDFVHPLHLDQFSAAHPSA